MPLVRPPPTTPTSWRSPGASDTTGRACAWLASCAAGPTTSCGSSETMSFSPPGRPEGMDPVRALPVLTVDAPRSAPALRLPPQLHRGRPKKTERPHTPPHAGHPIHHHVAGDLPEHRDKSGRPRARVPPRGTGGDASAVARRLLPPVPGCDGPRQRQGRSSRGALHLAPGSGPSWWAPGGSGHTTEGGIRLDRGSLYR